MNKKKEYTQDKEKYRKDKDYPVSRYLIAASRTDHEMEKEILYEVLGPVFFGCKEADCEGDLMQLFEQRYGVDVQYDFYEGDEHFEEYQEASQAIAEGMSIYGGEISFETDRLAELADRIWEKMESKSGGVFRRINTMLEE